MPSGAAHDSGGARAPRIAFIINSLAGGGAERVFCRLIAGLEPQLRGWEACVALLDDEPSAYALPAFAPAHTLDARGAMGASIIRLTTLMRRFRPDIALSFLSRANCANIIAGRALGYRTLISERVATADHFGAGLRARLHNRAVRTIYPRADGVVAVSRGVGRGLTDHYGVAEEKIEVISNPVDCAAIRAQGAAASEIDLPARFIVSVGRLTPNKNFALLLEAFARARLQQDLVVLGEGPERPRLEARARALGVSGRVRFLGFVKNPFAVMQRADMFASASNAEGFPNALVEAMALGLPCVFTHCPSGPAEILNDAEPPAMSGCFPARFGVLTPMGDAAAMAEAFDFLAAPGRRAFYALRARERAQCYDPAHIVGQYWSVLERMAAPRA